MAPPLRVLLIEDDLALAASLRLVLLDEGFEVVEASTARDGLRSLAASPDAVLLNLGLPDEDGVLTCERIRAASEVPVVIISARDSADHLARGLAAGADDYFLKPFGGQELADRVRALVGQPSAPAGRRLVGDLEVDPGTGTVRAAGTAVPLSRTEFRLLCELSRTPGRALDLGELMLRVWGRVPAAGVAALDARVRSAEGKLGDAGSAAAIVSADGRYRLQP